ncbi:MAG: hypothetical protein HXY24_16025 [Rubrivivax sp.]|nr:hypothetical protein [Rubrivivax sp.]
MNAPPKLILGEAATVDVTLTNRSHAEPLRVRDIDIQRSLLSATVESPDGTGPVTQPRLSFTTDQPHQILELHDYRVVRIDLELAPGESQTVSLTVQADKDWLPPASFRGETLSGHLDVSLGSFHNHTEPLTIAVVPPGGDVLTVPEPAVEPAAPPAAPSAREADSPPDRR